jgi:ADYC domain-containing protein
MSRILLLVAPWWIGGCVMNEAATGISDQAVISPNGVSANGVTPNVISPNGATLNGISPDGIAADGQPIGVAISGAPLAGGGLIGSTWSGHLSNGSTIALRIDDVLQGTAANADVWSYRLSVSAEGTWRPLCADATGNPGFADSVHGTWNLAEAVPGGGAYTASTTDFTLACRGSAIAKCVELGYKPWTGHARELAACVRALRGDYCGDGTPYTVNGTLVNLYDADGLQPDSAAWSPEAAWTPDGAACVSKKKATRFAQVTNETPWCFPHALKPQQSCGTEFTDGAVIITELPPL